MGLPGITSHLCDAPIHRITVLIHISPPQRFTFNLNGFYIKSGQLNEILRALKTEITTHSPFCKSIDHPSIRFYRAMVSVWWIYSEGS